MAEEHRQSSWLRQSLFWSSGTHQSASMLPKPIAFETGLVSLRMGGAPGFLGSRGAIT